MLLAKVIGTVVSTHKDDELKGIKLLLLDRIDPSSLEGKSDHIVALDAVGANQGEIVFYVTGSSSRMTDITKGKPTDSTIIGIIDQIELDNKIVYTKGEKE